jgi:hypothetical protein
MKVRKTFLYLRNMIAIDFSKKIVLQNKSQNSFVSIDRKDLAAKDGDEIAGNIARQHPITKNWFETIKPIQIHFQNLAFPLFEIG